MDLALIGQWRQHTILAFREDVGGETKKREMRKRERREDEEEGEEREENGRRERIERRGWQRRNKGERRGRC